MTHFCIHGASSLIGKNFCKYLLAKGLPITIFARKTSEFDFLEGKEGVHIYRYDRSLSELISSAEKIEDAVFIDMAWAGVFGPDRDTSEQFTINIPQVIASVQLANKIGAKHWIGFGSQAEYGAIQSDVAITEDHPLLPVTLYGKAKVIGSQIAMELCKEFGIEYSWLRLFSAYGPYGTHKWLTDHLIEEMKNNKTIDVTKCEQYLDYLYVDDISDMLLALSSRKGVGIANLGSGKATQLKKIIETIRSILSSKSVINYGALPYKADQGMFSEADISKLSAHTGWKPKISMEDGLARMIKVIS